MSQNYTITIKHPDKMTAAIVRDLDLIDCAWPGFTIYIEDSSLTFYSPLQPQQLIAIILQKLQEGGEILK